ncbi:hypothetical protein [Acinetobacter baumannii]|uniref:hypothetical protein n=1 Tax=Acinetobacter baumannii TaxID=470 RepID=UPI00135FBA33|nr:hypothetical protein [Acinetobacter baumannii]CAA0288925.1 hypothetical protein AB945B12_03935 [Acinetobacter baumannii]
MSHKIIKPDLDLVFARFAIFGMLAILFAVSYVNGHPSWLTWVVMLLGVFSIFEAAIKADEVLGRVIDSQSVIEDLTKRVIIQHRIIKYQDQKIDQLIELRGKEIKELRASYHGEMIGHEVHFKKIKQERDELQTLYTQQGINMLKLQKWVAWLEDRLKATDTLSKMRAAVIGSFNTQEFNSRTRRKMMILKQAEQALKGEG